MAEGESRLSVVVTMGVSYTCLGSLGVSLCPYQG
jgi:hypothetical protein